MTSNIMRLFESHAVILHVSFSTPTGYPRELSETEMLFLAFHCLIKYQKLSYFRKDVVITEKL